MERFARNLNFPSFCETEVCNYHDVARVSQLVSVLMRNARRSSVIQSSASLTARFRSVTLLMVCIQPIDSLAAEFYCHFDYLSVNSVS